MVNQYIYKLEINDKKVVELTLDKVRFRNNDFNKLVDSLSNNTTLTLLSLGNFHHDYNDLELFLESLTTNIMLWRLYLMFNKINDSGSNELENCMKDIESIVELMVGYNKIQSIGKINMINELS